MRTPYALVPESAWARLEDSVKRRGPLRILVAAPDKRRCHINYSDATEENEMLAGRIDREGTMSRIELPQGEEPEVMRALALRPELAHAVRTYDIAVWNSSLDWRLHELVRMRVAQINECMVCLSWRSQPALNAGVDDDLLAGVAHWRDFAAFTQAERVALEFAERYCTESARIDDGLLARLAEHFDPGEIVELTLVIAKYMAFGRFMQVLGLDQTCTLAFDETGAVVRAL